MLNDEGYTTPEGHWLARPLLLPDVRRLNEVFTIVRAWDSNTMSHRNGVVPQPELRPAPVMIGRNEVGPYCSLRVGEHRHKGLAVTATQAVIDVVSPRIVTDDDHLSFKVIEHKDRERCLVILDHNHIIGSHYLAYVATDDVLAAVEQALA